MANKIIGKTLPINSVEALIESIFGLECVEFVCSLDGEWIFDAVKKSKPIGLKVVEESDGFSVYQEVKGGLKDLGKVEF